MEGQDLRQTLVTIGISIVAADLMLAGWSAKTYQFDPPSWLFGATPLPFLKPPIRPTGWCCLATAIVIGVGLWLFLNRTPIGMMIRAGVDDRAMLACSGVNVQRVFAITFAIGAGLAGFAGVVGGTALSIAPGEDTRYLLASLVVVIVGGMGSVTGAAIGALLIGLAEQLGPRLFADLRRRLHLPHHGGGAGLPAAGHHGTAGMSVDLRHAPPASVAWPCASSGRSTSCSSLFLLVYPLVATPFWTVQIGAQSLFLGIIALSLMFLAGYGGMVSLSQMTVAGVAAYMHRDLRGEQQDGHRPGLALVGLRAAGAGRRNRCSRR